MNQVWSDLSERLEHETARGQSWVRDREAVFVNRLVSIQKYVEVDGAGSFRQIAFSPHGLLEREQRIQKFAWQLGGIECDHCVQKPGLRREVDGLGLIEVGNLDDTADVFEARQGAFQVLGAIANIGAE